MGLKKFEQKEDTAEPNHKRPYIHESVHTRVQEYATRHNLSVKEAYRDLVFKLIDENGHPHHRTKNLFIGERQ